MMKNGSFDFEKWSRRILEIRDHKTYRESIEFREMVYMVEGKQEINIAQILFKTFTNNPDYGVKESVVNVLGAFDVAIYYQAYFWELPRLSKETKRTEWYSMMAVYPGRALLRNEWDIILDILYSMPEETQNIFKNIISDEDFMDDNDWAEYVLGKIKESKK